MSEPKGSGSAIEIEESCNGKRLDPGFKLFGKTIPVCETDRKGEEDNPSESSKEEVVQGTEGNSNEGEGKPALKKPDKLLPCPRCESMDTKFCYYNNYNVNQPRHFCKNCQRYWTAGGTLRNVPVGAGRRKNKHSASAPAYRHVVSSEGGLAVRTDDLEGDRVMIPCTVPASCVGPLKIGNSRIQVVPVDALESAGTVLNFGAEKIGAGADGDAQIEWQSREDASSGSSITGSGSGEKEVGRLNCRQAALSGQPGLKAGGVQGLNGASPVPFYGGPWSYGWGFGYGSPSWNGPGWGGVSWPVASGPYLGPAAGWASGPWSGPWGSTSPNSSESGSPALGKHSREGSRSEGKTEGCLWVPKTLRIDDPGEAAKSSIWTTLGLGNKSESIITGGGIFKAFQPKTAEGTKHFAKSPAPSQVVHANPAAFSRSIAFQESS